MNRIKEARKASGLSQKYVAMTIGVAGPSVSNWESGKTKPTPENYISLAQLFGVTVDYLMGVDDAQLVQTKEGLHSDNTEKKSPVTDEEIKFALFDGDQEITDAQFEEVKRFAQYVRERDRRDK